MVAAGRYLKQLGATTVGALGISLGGSAVLGACHAEGADEALEGGILAVSPPADVRAMAKRLSRRLPLSHPAYAINRGFWAMLTSRIREAGWEGIEDFLDPIERVSAAVLRRRARRSSGGVPPPRNTSPTPGCRCSSCTRTTTR